MNDSLRYLIEKENYTNKNHNIEYTDEGKSCVAVYFSSNGIFYPDDIDTFSKMILVDDRYELHQNKIKRANKHIFVRDIYKSWYLLGISSKISSIEKLCTLLKQEVSGYHEVIMVGISSGGYAAILIGSMLKATTILAFSAQWSLYEEDIENKIAHKKDNVDFQRIRQYYNLVKIGNSS